MEVEICIFPGPPGGSKCPSDPQLIDRPTENLLFATLVLCICFPSILAEFYSKVTKSCNPWIHSNDNLQVVQEPVTEVFTSFLTKGLTTQKHCWQYTDPKKFCQLGHCEGFSCPVPNLNTPKEPSCYPKNIMLQFQICYYSHLNIS